jgi:hypothetical protein
MIERIQTWLRERAEVTTLFGARRKKPARLDSLYLLEIDHEISEEYEQQLSANLDRIREKFGIDFLVIERGLKLKRFTDV